MASEELDQDGMTSEALDFETLVFVIRGAKDRERLSEDQIWFLFRLAREQAQGHPDEAADDGNGRHCPAEPSRLPRKGGGPEPDAGNT